MVQTGHTLISDPRMLFTFECIDETAPTSVLRFFLSWNILKVEHFGLALIHDHVVRWVNLLIKLNPCILMFLGCYTSSRSYLPISRWVSRHVQVFLMPLKNDRKCLYHSCDMAAVCWSPQTFFNCLYFHWCDLSHLCGLVCFFLQCWLVLSHPFYSGTTA